MPASELANNNRPFRPCEFPGCTRNKKSYKQFCGPHYKQRARGWDLRPLYHLETGEDIAGIPIHHMCANKWCINPAHLQKASNADNTLEMMGRKAYEAEIALLKARIDALEARVNELEMRDAVEAVFR